MEKKSKCNAGKDGRRITKSRIRRRKRTVMNRKTMLLPHAVGLKGVKHHTLTTCEGTEGQLLSFLTSDR
jgi:hypothetical protein